MLPFVRYGAVTYQLICVSWSNASIGVVQELVLDPKRFPDPQNDHPLNQHEDSSWHAYFRVSTRQDPVAAGPSYFLCTLQPIPFTCCCQDAEMMEQIDRDVMRTHPDMHFFSGDGELSKKHREVCKASLLGK